MPFLDETGVQNMTADIKTLADARYLKISDTLTTQQIEDAMEEGWSTDLTGTTWLLNDTLNFPTPSFQYQYFFNVTFTTGENNSENCLKIFFDRASTGGGHHMGYDFLEDQEEHYRVIYDNSSQHWLLGESYKTITFTSKAQYFNSVLLTWLHNNATQIS